MMQLRNINRLWPKRIALIGNHLPRQCGIATFTTDLLEALVSEAGGVECYAVVMNDTPHGYNYPDRVRFEVDQMSLASHSLAADFLNMNNVDVACLQHEYGIFGGQDGAYILKMIDNLRMPIVTTLHTVLQEPSPSQLNVMRHIAQTSDRLVVMAHKAKQILKEIYDVSEKKIAIIPHGIPDVPFVDPNYYKDQFGVEGRKVLLTFGLLSPNKGIEYMIDALPDIIKKHPETVYMILGKTHPHVKENHGEEYRLSLQRRARQLGVDEHIVFHNRFVGLQELCEFLGAADIYVTPYLNREQIVSGTLAYALGTGKAVVSTGYWHAEEMLADKRGWIVPFKDTPALTSAVNHLLTHEVERHAMRKRAYMYCRNMIWKEVARGYLEVFCEVIRERENRPRVVFKTRTMQSDVTEVPEMKLDHLIRLTDDVGILQHASFITPNRFHGYCTDDNARALIVVLHAQNIIPDTDNLLNFACTYLSFLHHAFNEDTGRFRNFMSYERTWLEEQGSEDSHGRVVWALGSAIAISRSDKIRGAALQLFEKALPVLAGFNHPRTLAFSLVGIHAYLTQYSGDSEARRIRETLAERLFDQYRNYATKDWPWLEETLTYANAKIPQALILSGKGMQNEDMIKNGLKTLHWLLDIQTDPRGYLTPIGNNGWYKRGGDKARFAQQPIEAMNIIEACQDAYNVTGNQKWLSLAYRSLEWFLGRNDLNQPLYDYKTGGCSDGLETNGPNQNQGAESTLSWLLSLARLYRQNNRQISQENDSDLQVIETGLPS